MNIDTIETDIAIFGSGPAGVSAAYPFLETGLKVTIFDPGAAVGAPPPGDSYLSMRTSDPAQWRHLIGPDFEALEKLDELSPKFRVPRLKHAFEGYLDRYRIECENAVVHGSLASGGLSNAWGAGVSCFDESDLAAFPIKSSDLALSYRRIAERVGLSGTSNDDLSSFFGSEVPLQASLPMDETISALFDAYRRAPDVAIGQGVRIGRPRNAVLSEPVGDRHGCKLCGQCVLGCARRSIYHSQFDLEALASRKNFAFVPGLFAETLAIEGETPVMTCTRLQDRRTVRVRARKILLACGAVGSAAIAKRALSAGGSSRLLSNPVAIFALCLPAKLGHVVPARFFGLSQLSFSLSRHGEEDLFGNLYGSHGLPISDFVRRSPFGRRSSIRLFKALMPSVVIGMIWLHSKYSQNMLHFPTDGRIVLAGGAAPNLAAQFEQARTIIARVFRRYGAWMIPKTFTIGPPASDSHYAGTLPMSSAPRTGECDRDGEVLGLPNVHVVDGAALPAIPAKPHTFTIMANADRIASRLAARLTA